MPLVTDILSLKAFAPRSFVGISYGTCGKAVNFGRTSKHEHCILVSASSLENLLVLCLVIPKTKSRKIRLSPETIVVADTRKATLFRNKNACNETVFAGEILLRLLEEIHRFVIEGHSLIVNSYDTALGNSVNIVALECNSLNVGRISVSLSRQILGQSVFNKNCTCIGTYEDTAVLRNVD